LVHPILGTSNGHKRLIGSDEKQPLRFQVHKASLHESIPQSVQGPCTKNYQSVWDPYRPGDPLAGLSPGPTTFQQKLVTSLLSCDEARWLSIVPGRPGRIDEIWTQ
jgi:hypothetical protein